MRSPALLAAPSARRSGALYAALRLMRVEKPLCAACVVFLGAWLAAPLPVLWSWPLLGAVACVGFITAFGFVINDVCDLKVDSIGKPSRPLPAGRVSRPAAIALAWALAALGLAFGLALGGVPAWVATGAILLSAAYSVRLKSTLLLGNVTVALLVASVLVFGALVAGGTNPAVWTAACIIFTYIVAQEALFTLEDEHEDRAAGLHTTATWLGTERTARLVRALLVLFVVAALAPWVRGQASVVYAAALLVVSVAPAAVLWWWLRAPVQPLRVARAVRLSRLLWVTSFVPLALLK